MWEKKNLSKECHKGIRMYHHLYIYNRKLCSPSANNKIAALAANVADCLWFHSCFTFSGNSIIFGHISRNCLFMSLVLLVVGIERIAIGLSPVSSRKTRIIDIVLGVVIIGISIFLMQFPILTSVSLVILGAVALMIGGIARIVQGISREIPIFSKGLIIGVGALSVAISIAIIANPIMFGLVLAVITLAVTLLIAGIEMIYLGLRGTKKG
ncbi:MAG: hypothetical protein K0S67_438 [Nitrososphaeraceae archaeon]|nr:hypothetical protein [Nitrososphaeraceae archaeon]